MSTEPPLGELFKKAGKPTIFSELKGLGLDVKAVNVKGRNSYVLNPFAAKNAKALFKIAGITRFGSGTRFLLSENGQGLPPIYRALPKKIALDSLNKGGFLSTLCEKHGFEARVRIPHHEIVIERKRFPAATH